MFRVRVLSGKSLCFLACRFAELFDEDSASVISSAWFRVLLRNGWNKSKALVGATAHSQLCRPSQGLKPQAYNPTHPPEQASRLFVKIQRRFLNNKCPVIRTRHIPCWMLNLLLLTFSTDAKHFLLLKWPGSGKAQNWILFKSIFESLHGLLFVVTRSSCAPSTLFGLCFSVFGGSAKDNCLRCHHQNLLQLQTAFVQMNL